MGDRSSEPACGGLRVNFCAPDPEAPKLTSDVFMLPEFRVSVTLDKLPLPSSPLTPLSGRSSPTGTGDGERVRGSSGTGLTGQ